MPGAKSAFSSFAPPCGRRVWNAECAWHESSLPLPEQVRCVPSCGCTYVASIDGRPVQDLSDVLHVEKSEQTLQSTVFRKNFHHKGFRSVRGELLRRRCVVHIYVYIYAEREVRCRMEVRINVLSSMGIQINASDPLGSLGVLHSTIERERPS